MSGDEEHPGMLTEAIGLTMAENRKLARKELNDAIENSERRLAEKLVELEERLKSVPGKLPVVKAWRQESVTYQAEMVSHKGSLYQARRDTAQPPGGSDWICVARHGRDAVTPVVREPLSKRGKQGRRGEAIRGPQGEKGARGEKGDDALEIVNWHIAPINYRVVPFTNNEQAGKPLELRALFERFLEEVGAT
jgi:hypothetical protein